MQVVVVIPAYNEEKTIAPLIECIKTQYDVDVIVVNDNSSDNTESLSAAAGARVLNLEKNCGYNNALHNGINLAIASGHRYAITMDADGQHPPDRLQDFIELLESGIQFVFGYRPHSARWAEEKFSNWTYKKYGLLDPLCGMKGYDLEVLKLSVEFPTFNSVGTEIMMNAVHDQLRWDQVAIPGLLRKDAARFGRGLKPNLIILFAFLTFFYRSSYKKRFGLLVPTDQV